MNKGNAYKSIKEQINEALIFLNRIESIIECKDEEKFTKYHLLEYVSVLEEICAVIKESVYGIYESAE
jgi:hypothetical protein